MSALLYRINCALVTAPVPLIILVARPNLLSEVSNTKFQFVAGNPPFRETKIHDTLFMPDYSFWPLEGP